MSSSAEELRLVVTVIVVPVMVTLIAFAWLILTGPAPPQIHDEDDAA